MDLKEYLSRRNAVLELAGAIGIAPSVVSQWKNGVRPVPANRCPAIERVTGGVVRCEEMRPDVDWACLRGTATVDSENSPNTTALDEAA